jgi:hypothetical protein
MKTYRPESVHPLTWILFLGVALLLVADMAQFVLAKAPREHAINCSKMKTYSQALAALDAGATQLDTNHDGKPCQKQFPHETKK